MAIRLLVARLGKTHRLVRLAPYVIASTLTALTLTVRVTLGASLDGPTMVVFTIPIVLSAYWGGALSGMVATGISATGAAYYLLPPLYSFHIISGTQRIQEATLLMSGVLISGVCMRLHQARARGENVIERLQTTQQELRAALKTSGELRLALDEHAIVAVTNAERRFTFVNNKFCEISGFSREELVGRDHSLIKSGFHPPEFIQGIWQTIAHGNVWHGEIHNKAKDGSFYWVDTTIVPFLNEAGNAEQYIAISAEITERKRAEQLLRDNEGQFRTMANSMPQLAWIAEANGSINWYNERWYAYTGTTPEEMSGSGRQSVLQESVLPEITRQWNSAIETGDPFEMEFPLRGADGEFRKFLTRVHPLKDPEGKVIQWLGTNTDVDELKRAEEALSQLNATLEQRVIERTADVLAANRELEAFSYSVSHDLRAPLRAMNGFAEMTLAEFGPGIPAEAARYLDRIRKGGQQMGQLIDDLLAFSRLGRQPVTRQTVNTTALVQEVLVELGPQHHDRSVEFLVGALPDCEGDAALLKQVWINLLSNAIKYSRVREKAVVEIGARSANGEIGYFVRDNGTGFDMRYAHKLFGVFQRLHRADEFEGTGVGLAIVQRVVQRHGGHVSAEAILDGGATFHFTLPTTTAI